MVLLCVVDLRSSDLFSEAKCDIPFLYVHVQRYSKSFPEIGRIAQRHEFSTTPAKYEAKAT